MRGCEMAAKLQDRTGQVCECVFCEVSCLDCEFIQEEMSLRQSVRNDLHTHTHVSCQQCV